MRKRGIVIALLVLFLVAAGSIIICDRVITKSSSGKLFDDATLIPYNKVAILLGTSKFLSGGRENPYYRYRIQAAWQLLTAGKAKYLVISGDNSRDNYNEPAMMRRDLMTMGIDSSIIYLDYAGFRTFDSMVRLKEIFGQENVTVISQPFHNQRAIYIANREGIAAIGFNAMDVSRSAGWRVQAREKLARVKVFLDYILGRHAKYLGSKIRIPN